MSRPRLVEISHPWWRNDADPLIPPDIFDQHFGFGRLGEDDLLPGCYTRTRHTRLRNPDMIAILGNKFKVHLDVHQFTPDELTVRTIHNNVYIHGKHEEKSDEHGFISREFTRRYVLPDGIDINGVNASLTPDGILTVKGPRRSSKTSSSIEQDVPIIEQDEEPPSEEPNTDDQE